MDISKLSPMGQLNMKLYSDGKAVYDNLMEMSKNPMKYNEKLLLKLIEDNKNTEFGLKYDFANI